jgi:hypothetical protein
MSQILKTLSVRPGDAAFDVYQRHGQRCLPEQPHGGGGVCIVDLDALFVLRHTGPTNAWRKPTNFECLRGLAGIRTGVGFARN